MTTTTTESRIELANSVASRDITEEAQREPAKFLVAFAIGALVGVGLAAIWVPEPRRSRLPTVLGKRYRRARKAGATALEEVREASRELAKELREELATHLEAGREELLDLARGQIEQTRKALRREYGKLRR